jgi:hypothetical protein
VDFLDEGGSPGAGVRFEARVAGVGAALSGESVAGVRAALSGKLD